MAKLPIQITRDSVTPELVRSLLDYDPETGILTWKPRTPDLFRATNPDRACASWNTRFAGKVAFTQIASCGYYTGGIYGIPYQLHRAAWAIVYGRWPGVIDHINGDKLDNTLSNLREVSASVNARNRNNTVPNATGHRGVHKTKGGYRAVMTINKKYHHLGTFKTLEEAVQFRLNFGLKNGFTERHLTS